MIIRESVRTKQILLNFVTKDSESNEQIEHIFKKNLISKLIAKFNNQQEGSKIVGILRTNCEREGDTVQIDPDQKFTKILHGNDFYEE